MPARRGLFHFRRAGLLRVGRASVNMIGMEGKATRSHSQLKQYAECGEAFRLTRIVRAKSRPGWWFPGGTAVHATIERYLREVAIHRQ